MTLILSGTDGLSDVDGSAATPAVRGTDTNTGIFFPAADTIAFAEGGAEVARITNTGAWSFGASGTATGTNGQVLTSAGSGSAPTWTTPSTGALVFLSSVTANNSATVDVETTFSSTYDNYIVEIVGAVPSNNGTAFRAQFKLSGSYDTGANYRTFVILCDSGVDGTFTGQGNASAGSSGVALHSNVGSAASSSYSGTVHIALPASTSLQKLIHFEGAAITSNPSLRMGYGVGSNSGTGALTGIRFYFSSGNVVSGTFRLYGIANS